MRIQLILLFRNCHTAISGLRRREGDSEIERKAGRKEAQKSGRGARDSRCSVGSGEIQK